MQSIEDIRFYPIGCRLLLDVKPPENELKQAKDYAKSNGMVMKPEFHITVLGTKTGSLIETHHIMTDPLKTARRIGELLWEAQVLLTFFTISSDIIHIKQTIDETEARESLIVKINSAYWEKFFQNFVRPICGESIPIPPPHITLYSKSTKPENMTRGIALYSKLEIIDHTITHL